LANAAAAAASARRKRLITDFLQAASWATVAAPLSVGFHQWLADAAVTARAV